jgi:hypothetical protein
VTAGLGALGLLLRPEPALHCAGWYKIGKTKAAGTTAGIPPAVPAAFKEVLKD